MWKSQESSSFWKTPSSLSGINNLVLIKTTGHGWLNIYSGATLLVPLLGVKWITSPALRLSLSQDWHSATVEPLCETLKSQLLSYMLRLEKKKSAKLINLFEMTQSIFWMNDSFASFFSVWLNRADSSTLQNYTHLLIYELFLNALRYTPLHPDFQWSNLFEKAWHSFLPHVQNLSESSYLNVMLNKKLS